MCVADSWHCEWTFICIWKNLMRFARISLLQRISPWLSCLMKIFFTVRKKHQSQNNAAAKKIIIGTWNLNSCWNKVIENKSWFTVICKTFWKHCIITLFPSFMYSRVQSSSWSVPSWRFTMSRSMTWWNPPRWPSTWGRTWRRGSLWTDSLKSLSPQRWGLTRSANPNQLSSFLFIISFKSEALLRYCMTGNMHVRQRNIFSLSAWDTLKFLLHDKQMEELNIHILIKIEKVYHFLLWQYNFRVTDVAAALGLKNEALFFCLILSHKFI